MLQSDLQILNNLHDLACQILRKTAAKDYPPACFRVSAPKSLRLLLATRVKIRKWKSVVVDCWPSTLLWHEPHIGFDRISDDFFHSRVWSYIAFQEAVSTTRYGSIHLSKWVWWTARGSKHRGQVRFKRFHENDFVFLKHVVRSIVRSKIWRAIPSTSQPQIVSVVLSIWELDW